MATPFVYAIAALVAGTSAIATIPAQAAQLPVERFVTSDGSVFVLMPRPARGIVYWAEWIRMGRKHESETQAGLAEACAIASLAGTTTHGTSSPEAEAELLQQLDTVRRALRTAEIQGRADGELAALRAEFADTKARCANLSDRFAYQRLLTSIPASALRLTPGVDGYLLESSCPTDRVDEFAVLLASRRKDAVLRGYHEILDEVRARLRRESEEPGASHRRALALTALEVDPLRRVLIPPPPKAPPIARTEALEFYRRHHDPSGTTTVIVGEFDPTRVKDQLGKIFVSSTAPTSMIQNDVLEPPQEGPRTKVLISSEPRLLWGWRPPDDARYDALEVLAEWLQRRLEREFVRERNVAKSVRVLPRFPGGGAPAPFVVELLANSYFDFGKLEIAARNTFETLEREGAPAKELQLEAATVLTDVRRVFENPRDMASVLARAVGRSATRSLPPTERTLEAAFALGKLVFSESKRTTVTTRPPADDEEANR
ncbi:MAG: insulinase family protein [Planctomycetes bacterium]|nr:insulinase family protein [Planctomycetota bacterium]MCB9890396.1 insulinase family protein [Planctomycetota bacterium]MCB9917637.1 insulinase family protein [Planctomycetota bacterium]